MAFPGFLAVRILVTGCGFPSLRCRKYVVPEEKSGRVDCSQPGVVVTDKPTCAARCGAMILTYSEKDHQLCQPQ